MEAVVGEAGAEGGFGGVGVGGGEEEGGVVAAAAGGFDEAGGDDARVVAAFEVVGFTAGFGVAVVVFLERTRVFEPVFNFFRRSVFEKFDSRF